MFKIVTMAREYGSGGADVGRKAAELLGWVCVDKEIIEQVSAMGKVDTAWAAQADERALAWWARVMKSFRQGSLEAYGGEGPERGVDCDTVQQFTASVITGAAKEGKCVIIGRSSQCVLRKNPEALHVLVYAPMDEKVARMRVRHPGEQDLPGLLRRVDAERSQYTQRYYGCNGVDRGLFHLCVNSTMGVEACAKLIVQAVGT